MYLVTGPITTASTPPSSLVAANYYTASCGVLGLHNMVFCTHDANAHDGILNGSTLSPHKIPKDERDVLYRMFFERWFSEPRCVILTGPVNFESVSRGRLYTGGTGYHYCTYDFVDWLIENKVGIVVESPVFANHNYPMDRPSFCQTWTWLTPMMLSTRRVIADTHGIHGIEEDYEGVAKREELPTMCFDSLLTPGLASAQRFSKARVKWDRLRNIS